MKRSTKQTAAFILKCLSIEGILQTVSYLRYIDIYTAAECLLSWWNSRHFYCLKSNLLNYKLGQFNHDDVF